MSYLQKIVRKRLILIGVCGLVVFMSISFKNDIGSSTYVSLYLQRLDQLQKQQIDLLNLIEKSDMSSPHSIAAIKAQMDTTRKAMKAMDLWLRYLEPIAYKKINGPLPVEWETEVFEKFEKPYKREGAGLTLAEGYLEEKELQKEELVRLIKTSIDACQTYRADSITSELKSSSHFFLCNRLFILNLSAIYTTGFECPDTNNVIPELQFMLQQVEGLYQVFNASFPDTPMPSGFLGSFTSMCNFVATQPREYSQFDHFTFLKDYVNPLFVHNQHLIREYGILSKSYVDYSLSKKANSIFDKTLYNGQNAKGVFRRVKDEQALSEIDRIGKLLFFDPILSGNNQRSCASCHKPTEYFTDTLASTALQFDHQNPLARNTPTLINVGFNHLIMIDGKHTSLQDQTKAVITNPKEMGGNEQEILKKVLSCNEYKKAFNKFLKYTPEEQEVTMDHIVSAITLYYNKFSQFDSPFDRAMNGQSVLDASSRKGFNLFMSKAQCATCHFVPQFNGVKPPFVNSEFEVIGVPNTKEHKGLSQDKGRHKVHEASETMNAFRTGTLRNITHTAPYMHNGVFSSLEEVVDFYDAGGGAGKGLFVENQTLSSNPLRLSGQEKELLIRFMDSLDEDVKVENPPVALPSSKFKECRNRVIGGTY